MTLPAGNSRGELVPVAVRITARDWPSGVQSAQVTLSKTSRGAPPASGTRASVPACVNGEKFTGCKATAISPLEEMERIWAGGRPSERESELSKRVEKISCGRPSQAAP